MFNLLKLGTQIYVPKFVISVDICFNKDLYELKVKGMFFLKKILDKRKLNKTSKQLQKKWQSLKILTYDERLIKSDLLTLEEKKEWGDLIAIYGASEGCKGWVEIIYLSRGREALKDTA